MSARGPLSGIVIADLTRVLAGPYCTMLLAEMGARVIKIEAPGKGDDSRHYGPFMNGKSAYFISINRGKESIALDLKAEGDRAIFEKLLERVDVLVENYRPGTMERLGYGWDALHRRHPRLIYASSSGFGQTGPYAGYPAYDLVVQGLGGIMSVTGQRDGAATSVGVSIADLTAGLNTAIGINAALYHRAMTGAATRVDIAMLDCQVSILEGAVMRYGSTGRVPGPQGGRHPSITPFQPFRTEDVPITIAAGNDVLFGKLAAAIGRAELTADPRFVSNDRRNAHVDALEAEIEVALARLPAAHWIAVLEEAGVPCGRINTIADTLAHPQVAARNMLVTVDDPVSGRLDVSGNPVKLSGFPDPATRPPAPDLDADRDRILAELGL